MRLWREVITKGSARLCLTVWVINVVLGIRCAVDVRGVGRGEEEWLYWSSYQGFLMKLRASLLVFWWGFVD
jgi:hypothetical protein